MVFLDLEPLVAESLQNPGTGAFVVVSGECKMGVAGYREGFGGHLQLLMRGEGIRQGERLCEAVPTNAAVKAMTGRI